MGPSTATLNDRRCPANQADIRSEGWVMLDHFEWQAEDGHPIPVTRLRHALGLTAR